MKKTKSVTFQLEDPHEAQLFAAAQQERNFSGLIKRLYAKEVERRNAAPGTPIKVSGGGIRLVLGAAAGETVNQ